MAHAFQAIGSTTAGTEIVLAVFPALDDANAAFDQAEERCEAYRQEHKSAYAYVREVGYDAEPETDLCVT